MTARLHPTGPEPVTAFFVDDEGPYSLASMLEANAEDEETLDVVRRLAPGETSRIGIGGGGWIDVRCVLSPGFEFSVWNDTDGIRANRGAIDNLRRILADEGVLCDSKVGGKE